MISRADLIGYLRHLTDMERQIKMTYFFLSEQLGDEEARTLFRELEAEKQKHEDELEEIVKKLTGSA